MDTGKLQALIDRAIGKKGILRVPAWWMHKILSSIAEELNSMISQEQDFSNDFNDDFAI